MTQFSTFGLPDTLLAALNEIKFETATPIQAMAIPHALKGADVLGTAATGTGKTAAFAVPLITNLINNPNPRSIALVMTPTRELATQVMSVIEPLLMYEEDIKSACLIGGEAIGRQLNQLQRKPRVIVGTPGRINDHLMRRSLRLDRADFLVLDETDRMLDMGFGVQIEKIIAQMAEERQTLMFSATLPPQIMKMANKYLNNPERVTTGEVNKPAENIKQEQIHLAEGDRHTALTEQLDKRQGSVIVFVKTKYGADRLAMRLDKAGYNADAIHGDLHQRRRERVIQGFRDKQFRVLVATDVAARGLDIPHIEHVINYDLPQCPEDYIHRIGRTARAGAEGEAVNFITPSERGKWAAIERLLNPDAPRDRSANDDGPRRNNGGNRKRPPRRFRGDPGDANARRADRNDRGGERGNRGGENRGGEGRPPFRPKFGAKRKFGGGNKGNGGGGNYRNRDAA